MFNFSKFINIFGKSFIVFQSTSLLIFKYLKKTPLISIYGQTFGSPVGGKAKATGMQWLRLVQDQKDGR